MYKQIDLKELDRSPVKGIEKDIFKADGALLFKKTAHSELKTNAKDDGGLNFQSEFFDCCFTANTIYFWKDPIAHLMEIYRVLKRGGELILAFAEKNSGQKLPWTQPDFRFYEISEVKKIFLNTGFIDIKVSQITNKNGQKVVVISGEK